MRPILRFLLIAGICACQSAPTEHAGGNVTPSRNSSADDLTFLGTVTSIKPAGTGDPLKPWVVTARVDQVLSGAFTGAEFSFAIHSPAISGLEQGHQYRIRAARTREGYVVDEYQWSRQP